MLFMSPEVNIKVFGVLKHDRLLKSNLSFPDRILQAYDCMGLAGLLTD